MDFWQRLDGFLASHRMVIDRPKGGAHPRFPTLIYPLDYGYLEGTSAADGDGIDVWRGSISPARLVAVACTVDSRKHDAELKLLVGCTAEEIAIVERFHNECWDMSGMVLRRPAGAAEAVDR